MENIDLLSIGDATIDTFMTPVESETLCRVDTKECLIAFSYGDKIPVKNLEAMPLIMLWGQEGWE